MERYASAEDFLAWEDKARGMSLYSLTWAINDCLSAAREAFRLGAHINEGRYMDEAFTYMQERNRRIA